MRQLASAFVSASAIRTASTGSQPEEYEGALNKRGIMIGRNAYPILYHHWSRVGAGVEQPFEYVCSTLRRLGFCNYGLSLSDVLGRGHQLNLDPCAWEMGPAIAKMFEMAPRRRIYYAMSPYQQPDSLLQEMQEMIYVLEHDGSKVWFHAVNKARSNFTPDDEVFFAVPH